MPLPKSLISKAMSMAVCLASAGWCSAAVTYVDPDDILIPFSFGGVYLDIVTEAEAGSTESGSAAADSYTISYSEPAPGSWDVNFFFGGAGIVHASTFNVYREDSADNLSAIHNALIDEVVDGGSITAASGGTSVPLSSASVGGSGTSDSGGLDGTLDPTHMGAGDDQFASGSGTTGYIAFVLDPGGSEQYGWIRVTLADDGSTGLIHDWAYSDAPLAVGTIPEPSSIMLLLAGAMALMRRKR